MVSYREFVSASGVSHLAGALVLVGRQGRPVQETRVTRRHTALKTTMESYTREKDYVTLTTHPLGGLTAAAQSHHRSGRGGCSVPTQRRG